MRAPVVSVTPVADEVLNIAARHAVLPACVCQFIGPADVLQAGFEIVELRRGDLHHVWLEPWVLCGCGHAVTLPSDGPPGKDRARQ